jgi:hypothetical protein
MKKNFEILMAFFKPFRNKDIDFSWQFGTYDKPSWDLDYGHSSIKGVPENIMDYVISFIQFYYEKIEDDLYSETEWVEIGVRIYPEDKKLSFYSKSQYYSEEDDYYTNEINSPELEEYFKRTGVEIIEATYSGSGDSGDIDSVTIDGKSTNIQYGSQDDDEKLIWNTLYDQLENAYGGWEIDEGSSGTIDLNNELGIAISHSWNAIEWEDVDYLELTLTEDSFE